jgi:hypothetical protein
VGSAVVVVVGSEVDSEVGSSVAGSYMHSKHSAQALQSAQGAHCGMSDMQSKSLQSPS